MKMPQDHGPEDFLGWYRSPMTRAFLEGLDEDRQSLKDAWARRSFIGENADQTNFLNAKALAQVDTIDQILDNLQQSEEEAQKQIKERS